MAMEASGEKAAVSHLNGVQGNGTVSKAEMSEGSEFSCSLLSEKL